MKRSMVLAADDQPGLDRVGAETETALDAVVAAKRGEGCSWRWWVVTVAVMVVVTSKLRGDREVGRRGVGGVGIVGVEADSNGPATTPELLQHRSHSISCRLLIITDVHRPPGTTASSKQTALTATETSHSLFEQGQCTHTAPTKSFATFLLPVRSRHHPC